MTWELHRKHLQPDKQNSVTEILPYGRNPWSHPVNIEIAATAENAIIDYRRQVRTEQAISTDASNRNGLSGIEITGMKLRVVRTIGRADQCSTLAAEIRAIQIAIREAVRKSTQKWRPE
jgi:hypothetical protein